MTRIEPRGSGRRIAAIALVAVASASALVAALTFTMARLGSRDRAVALERARAALDRGNPDLALRTLDGPRDGPEAGEAATISGMALAMKGRFGLARRTLIRALQLRPGQPLAHKALGSIYLSESDPGRGIAHLRVAARLVPGDPGPWLAIGKAYHTTGDEARAAEAYREALDRDRNLQDARIGLIHALLETHRPDEAVPWLDRARQATPRSPAVLALAARHASDAGSSDEATGLATLALQLDPGRLDARLLRARLALVAGKAEAALADLEWAVALDPEDASSLQLLARVEALRGLTGRSEATLARFLEVKKRRDSMDRLLGEIADHPDDPAPRYRLGRLALDAGKSTLARHSFQAALDLDPGFRPALVALSGLGR